jgi:uncharacterized protein (TIGR02722 family)
MKRTFSLGVVLALVAVGGIGCAKRQVTRIDPGSQTDLAGTWNDTDSRQVAEQMIGSCLGGDWLADFLTREGRHPVLIVGAITNRTHEHINARIFLKDIEREMIGSGRIELVADPLERDQIRGERLDQLENASPETVKRIGMELGADFMMTGELGSIIDQEDGRKVIYYHVDLQLVNIESNQKVWLETKEIKKGISRGAFKL